MFCEIVGTGVNTPATPGGITGRARTAGAAISPVFAGFLFSPAFAYGRSFFWLARSKSYASSSCTGNSLRRGHPKRQINGTLMSLRIRNP